MSKVLVLGTGAWATALSQVLLNNHHEVIMYGINEQEIEDLKKQQNTKYFGDLILQEKYHRLEKNLDFLQNEKIPYVLFAVPSDVTFDLLKQVNAKAKYPFHMINAAKGFVNEKQDVFSNLFQQSDFQQVQSFSVLLGPGFSGEVIKHCFTVVNIAANDLQIATKVANLFNCFYFKALPITNLIGSEILACTKNPLAIVVGLLNGLNLSIDTIAAFLTLGLKEVQLLLKAYKIDNEILYSYCGFGDLYLTTSNAKSRNYSFGLLLAKYQKFNLANKQNNKTVEGINATKIVNNLFNKFQISTILFHNLNQLINDKITTQEFVDYVIDSFDQCNK